MTQLEGLLATQDYRPPFPDRHQWLGDLRQIRETGLDELFQLARSESLGVIVNVVAELQPYWIHHVHPGCQHVDHLGDRAASSTLACSPVGLAPGACLDNPEIRERVRAFVAELGNQYAGADNLLAWDAWNEFRGAVQLDDQVCYCPPTVTALREWLRSRYGDLEGLNRAWRRRYCSWEDVRPGTTPGRSWVELLGFLRFRSAQAVEQLELRASTLRAADPHHPIVAHAVFLSGLESIGEGPYEQALSRGSTLEMAERVDALGASPFPAWVPNSAASFGMRMEAARSAAGDRPYWVCGLQGGSARMGIETGDRRALRPSLPATGTRALTW